MTEQTYLEIAAARLGLALESLWDYHEGPGGIAFRTPDGYRHRFTFNELEWEPPVTQRAGAGSSARTLRAACPKVAVICAPACQPVEDCHAG